MKERGILCSGPMIRALLAGTKTQTRRTVKPQPPGNVTQQVYYPSINQWHCTVEGDVPRVIRCPYGAVNHSNPDRLYVKETYGIIGCGDTSCCPQGSIVYKADDAARLSKWKSSMFMPRAYSRITLEVVSVRCERLNGISGIDLIAEGMPRDAPVSEYAALWEHINGPGSWEANPWIWAIEFKRVDQEPKP